MIVLILCIGRLQGEITHVSHHAASAFVYGVNTGGLFSRSTWPAVISKLSLVPAHVCGMGLTPPPSQISTTRIARNTDCTFNAH